MRLEVWSLDCLLIGMDYEKMKALLEANHENGFARRMSQVKEFPKPDSRLEREHLDRVSEERVAA